MAENKCKTIKYLASDDLYYPQDLAFWQNEAVGYYNNWFAPAVYTGKGVVCKNESDDCREMFCLRMRTCVLEYSFKEKDDTSFIFVRAGDKSYQKSWLACQIFTFHSHNRKEMGWKKTSIYRCILPQSISKYNLAYYITGSRCWRKGPPLLSLYSLLIRYFSRTDTNLKCTSRKMKTAFQALTKDAKVNNSVDAERLLDIAPRLYSFFTKAYPKDFKDEKIATLFNRYSYEAGIADYLNIEDPED